MRHFGILVTVIGAAQLMTSAFLFGKDSQETELSKREKIEWVRLQKKNDEADDSQSNPEAGISFQPVPELEETPDVTKRENPLDILKDENKIDAPPRGSLKRRQVLSGDAAAFLKAHNDKRRIVNPTATNMKEMTWSTELETIARNYAEKCDFKHNEQRSSTTSYYVGENLYVSTGDNSPEDAVTSWDNEKQDYTLSSNVCDPNSQTGCGHYTQVVWADSETVGCVKHFCDDVKNFGGSGYLVVCNYGPGGNMNGRRPYTSGTTCKDCPAGYTCVNKLCSKSTGGGGSNPCSTNPCKNGGICESVSGNAVCKCINGWSGSTCETKDASNPCLPNPCQNGGSCTNTNGNAQCQCSAGWTGNTCTTQDASDPCSSNPCQNGGSCMNNNGSAECYCSAGWTGITCTTQDATNPCSSNPCQNGGSCMDNNGSAECFCSAGWTGSTCTTQDVPDPCLSNPCQNGGSCMNDNGNAECYCSAGWTGNTCTTKDAYNPCSPNPCQNGGFCWNINGSAQCYCSKGWTGRTCTARANTIRCNFERYTCLINYKYDDADFRRFSYFRMFRTFVFAPEGHAFACAYAGDITEQRNAFLISHPLADAVVKVQFQYRVVGSARLSFNYKQGKTIYRKFSHTYNNGLWQSGNVTIPPGNDTIFFFKAELQKYSLVGIDDVQITTI